MNLIIADLASYIAFYVKVYLYAQWFLKCKHYNEHVFISFIHYPSFHINMLSWSFLSEIPFSFWMSIIFGNTCEYYFYSKYFTLWSTLERYRFKSWYIYVTKKFECSLIYTRYCRCRRLFLLCHWNFVTLWVCSYILNVHTMNHFRLLSW